jgi:hypothetical protein
MGHYKSGKVPEVRKDRSASAEILPSFLRRERPLFLLGRYRDARNFTLTEPRWFRLVKYGTFQSSPPKAKLVVTGTPFLLWPGQCGRLPSPDSWNAICHPAYDLAYRATLAVDEMAARTWLLIQGEMP